MNSGTNVKLHWQFGDSTNELDTNVKKWTTGDVKSAKHVYETTGHFKPSLSAKNAVSNTQGSFDIDVYDSLSGVTLDLPSISPTGKVPIKANVPSDISLLNAYVQLTTSDIATSATVPLNAGEIHQMMFSTPGEQTIFAIIMNPVGRYNLTKAIRIVQPIQGVKVSIQPNTSVIAIGTHVKILAKIEEGSDVRTNFSINNSVSKKDETVAGRSEYIFQCSFYYTKNIHWLTSFISKTFNTRRIRRNMT